MTSAPEIPSGREFFSEYSTAALFHIEKSVSKPEDRFAWSREVNRNLLKLEREVFLAGWNKAFLLFMDECRLCDKCAGSRLECKNPKEAMPSPESLSVDLFATVRKQGYSIAVLNDYKQVMNRYALLLVE
jgi:predicted metal-binding protein